MTAAIRIAGSGVVCSIGLGVAQTWAAVRAGISRSAASSVHDRFDEPITMAVLPEDALAPADVKMGLPSHARRLIRLATPALQEALAAAPPASPAPLFLGLPEPEEHHFGIDSGFLRALLAPHGAALDEGASKIFPIGRASAFYALASAVEHLRQGRSESAVVGGVDSFMDLRRLARLDNEGRVLGEHVMDGFTPGEGAAFIILSTAAVQDGFACTTIEGVATAEDPGHRYAAAPAKGEALAMALSDMRTSCTPGAPAALVLAGFNGESFDAKTWGVAHLRHQDLLSPTLLLEHPADCFGDTGAAMGALLLALADAGLVLGHREGPALAWAASDHGGCGCAWLSVHLP